MLLSVARLPRSQRIAAVAVATFAVVMLLHPFAAEASPSAPTGTVALTPTASATSSGTVTLTPIAGAETGVTPEVPTICHTQATITAWNFTLVTGSAVFTCSAGSGSV
jgi:hypothetical protein